MCGHIEFPSVKESSLSPFFQSSGPLTHPPRSMFLRRLDVYFVAVVADHDTFLQGTRVETQTQSE